jgi:hypothetical protein
VTPKAWRDEYDEKVLLPMMMAHRKFMNPDARNTTNPPPAAPPDQLFDKETMLDVESDVESEDEGVQVLHVCYVLCTHYVHIGCAGMHTKYLKVRESYSYLLTRYVYVFSQEDPVLLMMRNELKQYRKVHVDSNVELKQPFALWWWRQNEIVILM